MTQRALSFFSLAGVAVAVVACTAGSSTTSWSGTEPPPDGGPSAHDGGSTPKDGKLGPECKEYFACCDDLAGKTPSVAVSCDSVKTQVESAVANGAAASAFEASCKSGVDALKTAGYCKPPVEAKECVPSCTKDTDCASSCPPLAGAVLCCDPRTNTCFGSHTATCPKPTDPPVDPPPSY